MCSGRTTCGNKTRLGSGKSFVTFAKSRKSKSLSSIDGARAVSPASRFSDDAEDEPGA